MFLVLQGKVHAGKGQGKKLGFPTINIPVSKVVRKNQWGIYFSLVKIGDKLYPGITHLGPAKTFQLTRATCETYLLSLKGNFYNKPVEKKLIFKVRDIEQFPDIKQLKKQIKKDAKAAKEFFGL